MTQELFFDAITDIDRMIVQAEADEIQERNTSTGNDWLRVDRYNRRRRMLREQREKLVTVYFSIYGNNPWTDIPV